MPRKRSWKRAASSFLPARALRNRIVDERNESGGAAKHELSLLTAEKPWAKGWLAAHEATRARRWEDAVESYTAILETIRSTGVQYVGLYMEALLGRGRARSELRDFDGALEDFAVARERWPTLIEPVLILAKAYWLRGNTERTQKMFEDLYERSSRSSEIAVAITGVYQDLQELDAGLAWASRIEDANIQERKRRALIQLRIEARMNEGNSEGVLSDCDELRRMDCDDAYELRRRGDQLREAGKLKTAIAAYTGALAIDAGSVAHSSVGGTLKYRIEKGQSNPSRVMHCSIISFPST